MTILNEYKNEIFRKICDVVAQIVNKIFDKIIDFITKYFIEIIDSKYIMNCLKEFSRFSKFFSQISVFLFFVIENL